MGPSEKCEVYNYNHVEFNETDPLRQEDFVKIEETVELSFKEKVYDVFANVTVEPCLFLFVTGSVINGMASQNLQLEKACRVNLNFSSAICDFLRRQDNVGQNVYESQTQKLLASALTWSTCLTTTLPCIFALFVGSFSDKTGYRKMFLIYTIIGKILIAIINIANVYYFYYIPLEAMIFSESLIEGLSGGWCICFLTAFAYISTITQDNNRTFRLGLLDFSMTVALPIGMVLSGVLLKNVGYYFIYVLTMSLHLLNLLYVIFIVKDPKRTREQEKHNEQGFRQLICTFFQFSNVTDTVSVVLKDAPNNRRLRLCILLIAASLVFGPMYGDMAILYMNVRYRFGWDEIKFSIFESYNLVAHSLGTTFSIVVFTKYLGWHDSLLGIVSTLSKLAGSFVYCFAKTGTIYYLAPLVEILNGTSFLAMRSIISKLVEPDELGKLSSLVGLVENLVPLIYVPLYLGVYSATMEVLPGAVYLLGSIVMLPAVAVLIYLFYEHRKKLGNLKSSQIGYLEVNAL